MSTKPGVTSSPAASISSSPRPGTEPTVVIRAAVHRHVSAAGLAAPTVGHQPAPDHEVVYRPCAMPCPSPSPASRGDSQSI